jgi:hypothetical protein
VCFAGATLLIRIQGGEEWLTFATEYSIPPTRKTFYNGDLIRTAQALVWPGVHGVSQSEVHVVDDFDCFVVPGGSTLLPDGDDLLKRCHACALPVNVILLTPVITLLITIEKGRHLRCNVISYTIPDATRFTEKELLLAAKHNKWAGDAPNLCECNVYWWNYDVCPSTKHLCDHHNFLGMNQSKIEITIEEIITVFGEGGAGCNASNSSRRFIMHVPYACASVDATYSFNP